MTDRGTVSEESIGPSALRAAVESRMDIQRTRLGLIQRGQPEALTEPLRLIEERYDRLIRKELEAHPVWSWLSQYPGLGGFQVARLVAIIGDPHRFPGRVCEAGHHHSAADHGYASEGAPGCGVELADESRCAAPVGPVRPGTGTRSLWHYLGLHVVDGRSPSKRRGHRSDWSPAGRTAVLMPGGIADAIVRSRVPHYRDIYDATKDRLIDTRADKGDVSAMQSGAREGAEVDGHGASASEVGLRPFQIDAIARKVAAKAFAADLLAAMKRAAPVEKEAAIEGRLGRSSAA